MRLRKPCEHGRYDAHGVPYKGHNCPGGEFLADDALVIERDGNQWKVTGDLNLLAALTDGKAGTG